MEVTIIKLSHEGYQHDNCLKFLLFIETDLRKIMQYLEKNWEKIIRNKREKIEDYEITIATMEDIEEDELQKSHYEIFSDTYN